MNPKRITSNFLQLMSFLIASFVGALIIEIQIPGNGEMCDPDQLILVYFGLSGIMALIIFLITAINDLVHNNQPILRKVLIGIIGSLILLIFTIDPIYSSIRFGNHIMTAENDFPTIELILYDNGTFYYYSYDTSCSEEFIGNYVKSGNNIDFKFNEKSDYLTKKYLIKKDSLKPIDVNYNGLIIKSLTRIML